MPTVNMNEVHISAAESWGTKHTRRLLLLGVVSFSAPLALLLITSQVFLWMLGSTIFCALIALGIFYRLDRLNQQRSAELIRFCQLLASGRSDTRWVTGQHQPELIAMNELARFQERLLSQLNSAASEVDFTAEELDKVSRKLVDSASEQQSQLDSIAAASEESSVTVQQIGRSIGEILTSANQLRSMSVSGDEDARQLEDDLAACQQIFQEAQGFMVRLREETQLIDNFISTIDDVANQTNLLALNAAIEAARAGESGRGFAVVADEVRGLASQTSEASQQITQLIKSTQNAVALTETSFERCLARLGDGVTKSATLKSAMLDVADFSSQIEVQIAQVEEASREHEAASESINQRMVAISDISADHHHKVCDALEIVEYLEQVAGKLASQESHEKNSIGGRVA
ncbi:methyl-accepting chemotaxis protein [Oceanospirillum sanctuarii]|uniref:methyl-accepting chemotaxis protein n=1 Tax=Oceanospirillum sanctuarii TaxID=1434821 RepID=UPI001593DF36|nr:methyl-accepting chemotaxis protein [Oceanospirillum sanctuarii]